jgi:hypothetical protein
MLGFETHLLVQLIYQPEVDVLPFRVVQIEEQGAIVLEAIIVVRQVRFQFHQVLILFKYMANPIWADVVVVEAIPGQGVGYLLVEEAL